MAITRSQIARQLLAAGGVSFESPGNTTLQRVLPRMDGMRPGFYGPDAGEGGMESSFGADTYSDGGDNPIDSGEAAGGSRAQFAATAEALGTPQTPGITDNFRANQLKKQLDMAYGNTRFSPSIIASIFGPPKQEVYNKDFLNIDQLGMSGKDLTRSNRIQGALDKFQETGRLSQSEFETAFGMPNFNTSQGEDSNPIRGIPVVAKLPTDIEPEKSDYNEFVQRFTLPEAYRLADGGEVRQAYGLGSIVKKVTGAVKKVVKSPVGKAALAGAAAFGIPGTQMGGLFGRASFGGSAPGMFGLGGIGNFFASGPSFKDFATDTVISGKSPFSKLLGKIPGGGATAAILGTSLASGILTPDQEEEAESLTSRIVDKTGIDVAAIRKEVQEAYANNTVGSLKNKYPFLITQSAAAAEGGRIGFAEGTQGDEIIEEEGLPKLKNMPEFKGDEVKPSDMMMASNIENDAILENLFEKYLDMGLSPEDAAIKAREEFDRMSKAKEPDRMMANEGGLMNLGGNEMDLRGGGFVPLGVAEKADDVPARLSKNEFVFTADAVRAAGGGSVDRGADLMYKTMKQLENKVA
jgi:hypothetical protein